MNHNKPVLTDSDSSSCQ